MTQLTVTVSGLNATDNPGPGVAIIRAIRAAHSRCRIIGLAYDTLDPGSYMNGIADHVYLVPYPSQGASVLRDRILTIHQRTPIDVLMPSLDAEIGAYLKIAPVLEKAGIRTLLPSERELKMRGKDRLSELGGDIRVPKSVTISDPSMIAQLTSDLNFPVMVKGQFYDAHIAYSVTDIHLASNRLVAKWGLPIIVQEYISGDEFDIAAVGNGEGGLVGAVPMRKMQLTDKGKAWGGITVRDKRIDEFVRAIMQTLKWRGPCEIEAIRKHDDGQLYLIEINPRFPAWVYLSVGAERNLPWASVRMALGESVEPMQPAQPGIMFLRHSVDQILSLSEYESLSIQGELHRKEIAQ